MSIIFFLLILFVVTSKSNNKIRESSETNASASALSDNDSDTGAYLGRHTLERKKEVEFASS